jgi:hypothetical protein
LITSPKLVHHFLQQKDTVAIVVFHQIVWFFHSILEILLPAGPAQFQLPSFKGACRRLNAFLADNRDGALGNLHIGPDNNVAKMGKVPFRKGERSV